MIITSTGALSQTYLLSSGYNAADAFLIMLQFVFGCALFIVFALFVAVWLPLRRG